MRSITALSLAAVAQAATFSTETIHKDSAPIMSSIDANQIPDSYIIKFKNHVDQHSASEHHSWVQSVHDGGEKRLNMELRKRAVGEMDSKVYSGLKHTINVGKESCSSCSRFHGYTGHFHPDVIDQIRNHPDVEYIELDTIVHTMLPANQPQKETQSKCDGETEKRAPWGLARISHQKRLNFGTYNKYLYAEHAGEGVDAYVIDTGTNTGHVDFEGRAHWGATIPEDDLDEDGNGHGTHCSGTIAGKKYGVAKKANIYAVKVLRSNGSGTMADVLKGVEYAAERHQQQVKAAKTGVRKLFKGSVANMSLGGGKTSALDAVVNAAVAAGVHFAVAAGNDNADACKYSPAAAKDALTVGASDLNDDRAYFSNYGSCTDIFGPGVSIQSTWIGSPYAVNTISGTSMASPHLAGLLAYYLSLAPSGDSEFAVGAITPKKLKKAIISVATKGALSGLPDAATPNKLAWNGGGCSDFNKIMEAGSYTVERTPTVVEDVEDILNDLTGTVIGGVEKLSSEVLEKAANVRKIENKAAKFGNKIHDAVDEQLKDFMAEL